MKLNEYIYNKIKELDYLVDNEIPSEEDIDTNDDNQTPDDNEEN